ncbi:MAG: hypothetical protein Ct9H300mP1_39560 [Planctomycetaceae bacterium]|nr:MAG: hypothetical protein Ct9H300mP1_39560 [Planctomycetaceae bacterium]
MKAKNGRKTGPRWCWPKAKVPQAMANAFQQGNLRAEDSI